MSNFSFLFKVAPFIYYSLYIILIILFTVSMMTDNISSFVTFYISLFIARIISNFIVSIIISQSPTTAQLCFYDYSLLTFNSKCVAPYLPLFVLSYTISYLLYTSVIVQKITIAQISILLFFFFYFICNICYMGLTKKDILSSIPSVFIKNIFSGIIFGLGFAYIIDHYINYNYLFFSTYKGKNIQFRCKI